MNTPNTTCLAFALSILCLPVTWSSADADIVRFNADIPNLGTVELVVNTDNISPAVVSAVGQQAANAVGFAVRLMQDWSQWGMEGAYQMESRYGDTVMFYGQRMSYTQVLDDRYAFARRWPAREYRIDPHSVVAQCDAVCHVSAEYDFIAEDPASGAGSAGRSTLEMILQPAGGRFVVVAEDGRVLFRH